MSDHLSDPPPYQPPPEEEDLYEWEIEDEGTSPGILWGRIIAVAVGLLLAFFIGRLTVGGGGEGDETELNTLRQRNAELTDDVGRLETELDAAREEAAEPETATEPTESPAGDDGSEQRSTEEYEVQAGDSFRLIAEEQYGDVGLAECIAQANGLTLQGTIVPGDILELPAEESCT